jgi:hypothetical protein
LGGLRPAGTLRKFLLEFVLWNDYLFRSKVLLVLAYVVASKELLDALTCYESVKPINDFRVMPSRLPMWMFGSQFLFLKFLLSKKSFSPLFILGVMVHP